MRSASETVVEPTPEPTLTVAFALVKGDRPEWIVQKLTELGVDRIVPFESARTVVRWRGPKEEHHLARLRKVAREAAMQSRRLSIPEITTVQSRATCSPIRPWPSPIPRRSHPAATSRPWRSAPRAASPPRSSPSAAAASALPGGILRTETAAVVAGALLVNDREGGNIPGQSLPGG